MQNLAAFLYLKIVSPALINRTLIGYNDQRTSGCLIPFPVSTFPLLKPMPISSIKAIKPDTSVRMVNGLPWPIRINNKNGGPAIDQDTILFQGAFDTVILGYRTVLGLVPPRSTFDSFLNAIKDSKRLPNPAKLDPQAQLYEFGLKNLKPYAFVTHVPLPQALASIPPNLKDKWPQGVVTGSYFKSQGLAGGKNSLLGGLGLIPLLETSSKNLVDVVTTVDFIKKEGDDGPYFANEFSYWTPEAEDKEAIAHLAACKKFIEQWTNENPNSADFPLPADQLVVDISTQALLIGNAEFEEAAFKVLSVQARAVFPPEDLQALDVQGIVASLVHSSDLMALSPAEVADNALSTIEVKPID